MNRRNLCKLGLAGIGTMPFSGSAHALKRFAAASEKKKWVVLYGTQCGSTGEYASFINKGLGDIADVVNISEKTPSVDEYDYFIVGGWRNSQSIMPKTIPDFVKNNKDTLKDKIKGLFVVLGNMGNPTLDAGMTSFLNDNLVTPSGATTAETKVFFGRYGSNCQPPWQYDNVSEDAGVEFGQSILSTALKVPSTGVSGALFMEQVNINPLTASTPIRYTIPEAVYVDLSIYTLSGYKITTLVAEHQRAGNHSVLWNTTRMAPGFYLCRLKADGFEVTRTARVFA